MTKKKSILLLAAIAVAMNVNAQAKKPVAKKTTQSKTTKAVSIALPEEGERLVEIKTQYGVMIARLYNQTPLHRDNFVKLVKQGFYDSLLFHRVMKQFMLQGGDPKSKNAAPDQMLGTGSAPGEKIPAEFNSTFFHKKGSLAAARDNNALKASSNSQFYIVEGKPVDTATLSQNPQGVKYSPQQKEIYARMGGTPFLDQNYTVFGEVISGLDVIDRITAVQTQANNRPLTDIPMTIKLLN